MKREHYVVFGAGRKPNKSILTARIRRGTGPGKWMLRIEELENSGGKYAVGDPAEERDVSGVYTTLYFTERAKDSVRVLIRQLQRILEDWDQGG